MERFVFRLQKVLDHKLRIEDEKERAFVKSRLNYLKEKDKLDLLYKRMEECSSDTVEKKTGAFSYIAKYNYMMLLEERIEDQIKMVKVCKDDMNEKKTQLEESKRDRKVLDKLKENSYKQYKLNNEKLEQMQNDEFALYGYVRK